MTLEEAKELAIKKWQWIVDHDGINNYELEEDHPELAPLMFNCSYCDLFYENECKKCPLNLNGINCRTEFDLTHPFNAWTIFRTKESAQKVLDLIKSL